MAVIEKGQRGQRNEAWQQSARVEPATGAITRPVSPPPISPPAKTASPPVRGVGCWCRERGLG